MKNKLILISLMMVMVVGCKTAPNAPVVLPPKTVCDVANPLTDLPWLSKMIADIEMYAPEDARIYQCTYRDGVGFLLDFCVNCYDPALLLVDCQGNTLCTYGGIANILCEEFAVDFENKKLIYPYN